jgi:hypothetical protein
VRDLTGERLDRLCGAYALKTLQEFNRVEKNILYILLVISFVLHGNQFSRKNGELNRR